MFAHLKIENIKGIKQAVLNDLGKINIICGKNNSGKSSLLEGIASDEHRTYGLVLGEEQVQSIFSDSVKEHGWRGGKEHRGNNEEYQAILVPCNSYKFG